jgi:putative hemolysin
MTMATRSSLQLGVPGRRGAARLLCRLADRLGGLRELDRLYSTVPVGLSTGDFLAQARQRLALDCEIAGVPAELIPREGALVVVCNHPFGGADALLLTELLLRHRSDLRVLANQVFERVAELAPILAPLDILGTSGDAMSTNRRSLRAALRHLDAGGALLLFPAGEVAHMRVDRRITDRRWHALAGWLVRRSGAAVLPACFEGRNPWWFHAAGWLHPRLRSVLLPRVLLSHRGRSFRLHLGRRIPGSRIDKLACEQSVSDFLRAVTLSLPTHAAHPPAGGTAAASIAPLAEPVQPELLQAEVARLGASHRLLKSRSLQVCLARAQEIPWLLREIGRLRELTFRAVGEGTGHAVDLDRFDEHYLHLFIWDVAANRVVGAYRLGPVDEILADHGRAGLYTYSLFRYSVRLLEELGTSVELGRSFIVPDYQKSFAPLLLLWRGIGAFLARNPRYRTLFGPVSISADYHPDSRRRLVRYLRRHAYDAHLARRVKARRPYRSWPLPPGGDGLWRELGPIADVELFSSLLGVTEHDGKGVPVLLRQYLKLGGRVIGFNVDRDFRDALDGLIVVDLLRTAPEALQRYMGPEDTEAWLAWHRKGDAMEPTADIKRRA